MALGISPTSADTRLETLLNDVNSGKIQLPEFQRSWTWDDNRIRAIIASLTSGYPMGVIMCLKYGNADLKFKYRTLEGVDASNVVPEQLVLDGQQRLTSIYQATYAKKPVNTTTDKGKKIKRYYYLDIKKCLDESEDRYDAVISVPEDRKIKYDFDRKIKLDLSKQELEFKEEMFPLNIIFDSNAREDWGDGYKEYYENKKEYKEKYKKFRNEILDTINQYQLPVIKLDENTPREAVCKVFENVNTGGVALTVFELVTAAFAAEEFDLRKDWEACQNIIWGKNEPLNTDIMYDVDQTAYLTSVTLYTTYLSNSATTCKKKDVLALKLSDYIKNRDVVLEGYKMARKFLLSQCVFRKRDLPYTTQLIPLSAICAVIGKTVFEKPQTTKILAQWFWCGILGEMYGGANETRYANDIEDVVAAIKNGPSQNRTINAAFFSSTRLLSLRSRGSAAYKGIMALIYNENNQDFMKGIKMDVAKSMDENPDIHHIFPESYCIKKNYPKEKWNSIVNKTPLLAVSNRSIGGDAPSKYSKRIMKTASVGEDEYKKRVESNLINYDAFIQDDFDSYFIDRAKKILFVIEKAMGKRVADRNSEQTVREFGCSLE